MRLSSRNSPSRLARNLVGLLATAASAVFVTTIDAQQRDTAREDPRQQAKQPAPSDTLAAVAADARRMLQALVEQRQKDSLRTVAEARRRDSTRRADSLRSLTRLRADSVRYARSIDSLRRIVQVAEATLATPEADSLRTLTIEDVVPRRARPGDTIAIVLSRPLRDTRAAYARFGAESTSIINVRGSVVYVKVPDAMATAQSAPIVVAEDARLTPPIDFAPAGPAAARSLSWVLTVAAGAIVMVAVLAAGYVSRRRVTREHRTEVDRLRRRLDLGEAAPPPDDVSGRPPVPEVPAGLVAACASNACVLFAGPGLAAQGGLPTGRAVLEDLIEAAAHNPDELASLHGALNAERYSEVAEIIHNRMGPPEKIAVIKRAFDKPASEELPRTHRALRDIGFAGALTSSWDPLVERVARPSRTGAGLDAVVLYPKRPDGVPRAFREDEFYLTRLHGEIDHPDTFAFTFEEAYLALRENRTLSRYVTSLALSRTVLFLGTGLGGVEDFFRGAGILSAAQPSQASSGRVHYALVPYTRDWSIQEERFRSKYAVQLLGYVPSEGHREVAVFAEHLADQVREARALAPERILAADTLSEVRLHNIGAFRDVAVSFTGGWNLILGSNGSGKSTILKAIALGLSGDDDDAARVGGSLLRTGVAKDAEERGSGSPDGSTKGWIELTVGSSKYTTTITRANGRTRVGSGLTALQSGSWVVMGFPPLRGVSTEDPDGPGGHISSTPEVADLLPLISGAADSRLDDLKQWIVNLDYHSRAGPSTNAEDVERNRKLLEAFFEKLKILMEENKLEFREVREVGSGAYQVIVDTDDGPVPIDLLSQGMTSIIGWVGAMLQRMYEIHRHADRPEDQPALVLVDEIDAHLHPGWQQQLVPRLRKCFPRLQVIATTHSPLLVAGMKASEVLIARRDPNAPDRVSVTPAPLEFEGMRADQILTSEAFGLMTTRGPETQKQQDRFVELLGQTTRTQSEEREFQDLEDKLGAKFKVGESRAKQRVEEALEDALIRLADPAEPSGPTPSNALTPELRVAMKQRLAALFPDNETRAGA